MLAVTLPLLSAAVGLVLSWSAQAGKESPIKSRAIWLVVLYSLMVHAPLSAALLTLNPDWSFAYTLPGGRVQTAAILTSSLLTAFGVPYGFLFGSAKAKQGSDLAWLIWSAPLLVLAFINTMLFLEPITKEATYLSYHNDFGVESLAGSPLAYSLIWALVVGAVALGFTHTQLRQTAQEEHLKGTPEKDA